MMETDYLERARREYDRLAPFRAARQRFKLFTYGHQWGDIIILPDGSRLTEGEYASLNGRPPITNNMIHRLVTTIVGHFRSREDQANAPVDHNHLGELDARMLEEFLISGCAVQRIVNERRPEGDGVWVDNVNPDDFFCSEIRDPRGLDMELVGMFHDWSLAETVGRFARGSKEKAEEIKRLYGGAERCRVIEVWTLEAAGRLRCHDTLSSTLYYLPESRSAEVTATNRKRAKKGQPRIHTRLEYSTIWQGRFLTPEGILLRIDEAGRHPFVVKFYPLMDGEIHPFVEGLIDQQKHVNRLITLIDNMMSSSAKGVLLFPENQICEDYSWNDIRNLWASYDGVIPYNPQPGSPGPQQVVTNPATSGAYELVNLEMKLFEKAGGVSDTLQGRNQTGNGNSATLYDAQTRNSMAALADIFRSFDDFRASRSKLL
ncbi:MAG: hypothetical protein NC301_02110 [Bacteroides sp.]|nr:hypothetical protein [Bacteroides sp.]MCM1379059.1 hypothetical protein [Bacteroides sp.]MCM1445757.1 hypothetical protein [Prevotella sp.]